MEIFSEPPEQDLNDLFVIKWYLKEIAKYYNIETELKYYERCKELLTLDWKNITNLYSRLQKNLKLTGCNSEHAFSKLDYLKLKIE